jgi:hypothetical protein
VPDGDLVTKYVNGKVKARMFVPVEIVASACSYALTLSMGSPCPNRDSIRKDPADRDKRQAGRRAGNEQLDNCCKKGAVSRLARWG